MRSTLRLEIAEAGQEDRPISVTRKVFRDGTFHSVTEQQMRPCTLFRISCPEPVIALPGGWRYAGYIAAKGAKRDSNTGETAAYSYSPFTASKVVEDDVLRSAFNDRGMMRCDHCNTFRNRRVGLVIQSEAGETKIVGSSCVNDFLGHDYKRVLGYYQHISSLRDEVDRERNVGWYAVEEYDFEAARKVEETRKSRTYTVREIVGAIRAAMIAQGFYARYSGSGKVATSEAANDLLRAGLALTEGEREAVDAIIAWVQERTSFPYQPDAEITLGDYEARDPDYQIVQSYARSGNPLVGEFHFGSVEAVLTLHKREQGEPNTFGPQEVPTTDFTLVDQNGAVYVWNTASWPKLPNGPFKAKFSVKRSWLDGVVAKHAITRLRVAA